MYEVDRVNEYVNFKKSKQEKYFFGKLSLSYFLFSGYINQFDESFLGGERCRVSTRGQHFAI